jgi:hypothetical protein
MFYLPLVEQVFMGRSPSISPSTHPSCCQQRAQSDRDIAHTDARCHRHMIDKQIESLRQTYYLQRKVFF